MQIALFFELTMWSLTESQKGAHTRKRHSPVLSGLAPRMSRCPDSMNALHQSISGGNLQRLLSGYLCIGWTKNYAVQLWVSLRCDWIVLGHPDLWELALGGSNGDSDQGSMI
jgi:hypothetical protein